MLEALAAGGRDLSLMRIVASAGIDPPCGWGRFDASFQRIRATALRVLRANIPGIKASHLDFRTRCAAGLVNWLVLALIGVDLRHSPRRQLERLIVTVFGGGTRPGRKSRRRMGRDLNDLTNVRLAHCCQAAG